MILAAQGAAQSVASGDVIINVPVLIALMVSIVGSLAGVVALLYKAQTAAQERIVTEMKVSFASQVLAMKDGTDGQINILQARVEVLVGRESALLVMVGEKDRYVLDILNNVVATTRDQTTRHDEAVRGLVEALHKASKDGGHAIEQSSREHKLILEAIRDNGKAMLALQVKIDAHEANQAAHRHLEGAVAH